MKRIVLAILMICVLSSTGIADTHYKTWQSPRDYEPIIFNVENIPELSRLPLDQLYVYTNNSRIRRWTQIPFQIDKYYGKGRFRAAVPGEIFGDDDELIIMARDLGNKAPSASCSANPWPIISSSLTTSSIRDDRSLSSHWRYGVISPGKRDLIISSC